MMSWGRRFKFSRSGLWFVVSTISVTTFVTVMILCTGVMVNFSPSMTPGIWIRSPIPLQDARGAAVIVKQDNGLDVSKYAGKRDLLKRILAISGDIVSYDGNNLTVNGTVIANSKIYEIDGRGDLLPKVNLPITVPADMIWLFSDDEKGYDSRYFGPVPLKNIKSGVQLIWRFSS